MAIERFEDIVEAAKEQEIEIQRVNEELAQAIARAERAEKRLKQIDLNGNVVLEPRDTEVIRVRPGAEGERVHPKHADLSDLTGGIPGITARAGSKGFIAQLNFINPETGKKTTKQAKRDTLVEAIIARNEIAANLLRQGIYDLERFAKFTYLPL